MSAVPIILLTGFLGSGKTTLLQGQLGAPQFADTVVIINEFGEVSIDHLIVANLAESIVELRNGCLCCSIRGDLALTRLEPEDRGGGYAVDDKSSAGYRLLAGYVVNDRWSLEAFWMDAGEAGIASQNPVVGHLGELEYHLFGVGAEWAPLDGHRDRRLYPALKFGLVGTDNSVNDDRIAYEQNHEWGLWFAAAGIWRVSDQWRAQVELTSYDKDEFALSLGVRRTFR
ncbi:MAG: hypothetical protein J0M16_05520 [Gammaproteobacteria bacterium]|nr:hypothetical protein [Gammaproteobacteria bacterium]